MERGSKKSNNRLYRKVEEKGSEITTKDLLEELGDDFRKNLSELSFEKAEKEYKKIRDHPKIWKDYIFSIPVSGSRCNLSPRPCKKSQYQVDLAVYFA